MNSETEKPPLETPDGVLDASVILAALLEEPGSELAADLMPRSLVLSVNYGEAAKKLIQEDIPVEYARKVLEDFGLEVVPYDRELALLAASLYPVGKPFGLSHADRACLALAVQRGLPVYTADREWTKLTLPVEVHVIR